MKITIETTNSNGKDQRKAIIEVASDYLDLDEMFEDLIRPALLAFGFQSDSIANYLNDEEDEIQRNQKETS